LRSEIILAKLLKRIDAPVSCKAAIVNGVKTSYLEAGSGQPVILIHGGDSGVGGIRWLPVIGPLSRHFNVIAPDMPGYGESDKPSASYDRKYFSQWLNCFVNVVNLSNIRIIAHSLGGAVALQYALEKPSRIKQLVLVNSAGLGKASQKVSLHLMFRMMWNNLFPTPRGSEWFLRNQVLYDPTMINQELLELEEYGRAVVMMPGGKKVFWLGRGRAIKPFQMEFLKRVLPSTLIIWGAEDTNFPLSAAQAAAKIMPNAHLHVIKKAKHLCYYDQTEEFNKVLISYLLGR